ncbi:acyl-ACP--UDP-N-acetylglucosamine O-acyltransferase [Mucisphaera sp.]|uniref:acyl-ACP--UDP-N-acetylglucosamine O-acyltransferase n=1 Tax=Mucisphaera sp. TaxID=2913024 RepID=UPI003D0AC409
MPKIHPTAIISDHATLADDVEIGPWCIIEGEVTIGPGTRLLANVHLQGPLTLGEANTLYPHACIGFAPQDRKFQPTTEGAGTRIGHRNILREAVTIHRATGNHPTTLGDDNYLMVGSHMGHDATVGDRCNLANAVLLAGHATVQNDVTIGGGAAVHQNCRIGNRAMIAGVIGVVQDVLPFTILYHTREMIGLNLVGLRRAGMRDQIKPLQKALELACYAGLSNKAAVARIRTEFPDQPACLEMADFIETTTRGIMPFNRRNRDEA